MTLSQIPVSPVGQQSVQLSSFNAYAGDNLLHTNVWVSINHQTFFLPIQIGFGLNSCIVKTHFVNPSTGGDASIEMEYDFNLLSLGSVVYGTECKDYPIINDSPRAGKFNILKLVAGIIAAVAIIAVIAYVAPIMLPAAAVTYVEAGCNLAIALCAMRVIGDVIKGNPSEETAYMFDGGFGFVSGAAGKWVSMKFMTKLFPKFFPMLKGGIGEKAFAEGSEGAISSVLFDLLCNSLGVKTGIYDEEKEPLKIARDAIFSGGMSFLTNRLVDIFNPKIPDLALNLTKKEMDLAREITDAITGTTHGSASARANAFKELTGLDIIGKTADLRALYGATTNVELATLMIKNPRTAITGLGLIDTNSKLKLFEETYQSLAKSLYKKLETVGSISGNMGSIELASFIDYLMDQNNIPTISDADEVMREIGIQLLSNMDEKELLELLNSSE